VTFSRICFQKIIVSCGRAFSFFTVEPQVTGVQSQRIEKRILDT
jgi:hypothetical protein